MSASSDVGRLQEAEQKLLAALGTANQVVQLLGSGASQAELECLTTSFLADVQDSQVTLLQLADKHQQPLPYQSSSYRHQLELLAAQKQVAAVQAQLQAESAGPQPAQE